MLRLLRSLSFTLDTLAKVSTLVTFAALATLAKLSTRATFATLATLS